MTPALPAECVYIMPVYNAASSRMMSCDDDVVKW